MHGEHLLVICRLVGIWTTEEKREKNRRTVRKRGSGQNLGDERKDRKGRRNKKGNERTREFTT